MSDPHSAPDRRPEADPPLLAPDDREPRVRALVEEFLAAVADPRAGARLLRLHDARSPIFLAGRVAPARETSVEAFARAHRVRASARPTPALVVGAPGILGVPEAPGGPFVAWFEVSLPGAIDTLWFAAGCTIAGKAFRLAWCTLARSREPWGVDEGRRQTLADYGFLDPTARTWLDGAVTRLFPPPMAPFLTLESDRFSCQMSAACCRHDYQIVLPPAAQALVDAIPWETIAPELAGTRLAPRPDGMLQLKDNHERCRFLDGDRRCRVHQALGRQPFGPCAVFPLAFAETPEGLAVTASPICGSVRARLGPRLAEREADLRFRLAQAPVRRPDGFRLAPDESATWESFRDAEAALRGLLDREDLPFFRRLDLGARLLSAWPGGRREVQPAWESTPLPALDADFRATLATFLARIFTWDRAALKPWAGRPLPAISHARPPDPLVLATLVRTLHFSKVYSYPYDLATAHNLAIILYLVALLLEAFQGTPLMDEAWQELASLADYGLLATLIPPNAPPDFRAFMGSPELGRGLLAFAGL